MLKPYKEMIFDYLSKKCFKLRDFEIEETHAGERDFLLIIHQKTLSAFLLCNEECNYNTFMGAYTPFFKQPVEELRIHEDLQIEFPEEEEEFCDFDSVLKVHLPDFIMQIRISELYKRMN